jgi:hypothetical protein
VTHTTGALDNKFVGSLLNAVFVIFGLDLAWRVSKYFCPQIFLPEGSFGLPASPVYRWFEKTPENGSFIPECWG